MVLIYATVNALLHAGIKDDESDRMEVHLDPDVLSLKPDQFFRIE
jgi:hypothetical protein